MAEAPVVLTAKQASTLARIERQETNLARIKEANTQRYCDQVVDLDLTPAPPERKPAFALEDDQRPYLKVGEEIKGKFLCFLTNRVRECELSISLLAKLHFCKFTSDYTTTRLMEKTIIATFM